MDNSNTPTLEAPITTQHPTVDTQGDGSSKKVLIFAVIAVVLVLAILIGGLIFLATTSLGTVARVRDIFIIFMALESLLIGITLVILIVQMARLINLLQNEIKPILDSTNETVSNLRGTTAFLSDNVVQPVIKLNEYLAALSQGLQVLGLARKRPNPDRQRRD